MDGPALFRRITMSEEFEAESREPIAPPPTGNALAVLEHQVTALGGHTSTETLLAVRETCRFYQQELKRLRTLVEAEMIGRLGNGERIYVSDTVEFVLSLDKTTKCNNVPATLEAIMQAVGGDYTRTCDTLSANAIKHGAARRVLAPPDYDRLFTVTIKKGLDEKPIKKLTRLDQKFMK
jgi:hypothetical protein